MPPPLHTHPSKNPPDTPHLFPPQSIPPWLVLLPTSLTPPPPDLNHRLVFLAELPQVLILLFGIMSLHAGLDTASPGKELLLRICGSSGLLICGVERQLTQRFKSKKKKRLLNSCFIENETRFFLITFTSVCVVVALIMADCWTRACCSLATVTLWGGLFCIESHFEVCAHQFIISAALDVPCSDETI